jgi:DNA-binding NarL/FixJ family response regulator
VRKILLPELSDGIRQRAVVLCGDLLPHRKRLVDSLSKAAGVTLIRCPEDQEEAVSLCRRINVSLLVARQSFLEQLPRHMLAQITNFGKGSCVLAVLESETFDKNSVAKVLWLGCRGVLPHRFSAKLFRRAVLAILKGELWAPRGVVSDLLSDLLRAASLKEETGLTPQEARILELSLQGYKNSAIADALFISLETVRWHKRRLNRKLHASNPPRYPQMKASGHSREEAAG